MFDAYQPFERRATTQQLRAARATSFGDLKGGYGGQGSSNVQDIYCVGYVACASLH